MMDGETNLGTDVASEQTGQNSLMPDEKTQAEWARSKRIEEERMKAARALNSSVGSDVSALAALPVRTDRKGFRRGLTAITEDAEKYADRSVIFALTGAVLDVIGQVGGMVTMAGHLGSGGVIISGLPSAAGMILLALAVLSAAIALIVAAILARKNGIRKSLGSLIWSAIGGIALVVGYVVVKNALLYHN